MLLSVSTSCCPSNTQKRNASNTLFCRDHLQLRSACAILKREMQERVKSGVVKTRDGAQYSKEKCKLYRGDAPRRAFSAFAILKREMQVVWVHAMRGGAEARQYSKEKCKIMSQITSPVKSVLSFAILKREMQVRGSGRALALGTGGNTQKRNASFAQSFFSVITILLVMGLCNTQKRNASR